MTLLARQPTRRPSVPPPPPPESARPAARGTADTLALAWIHGSFSAATFRRGQLIASTEPQTDVPDLESFGSALDQALAATRFRGTETLLLLAHPEFIHQTEACPAFADGAVRSYLRGRVERFEQQSGPVLSVSQPAARVRNEVQHILHLLPHAFYLELNRTILARHLDLTRIVPATVPLQLELDRMTGEERAPVLMAVRLGLSTAMIAAGSGGEILLSRTTPGEWSGDPSRAAVEINRSLLYAKQQHGVAIERIHLAGDGAEAVRPEIEARCGGGMVFSTRDGDLLHWLSLVSKLNPRHPVNLVAGYLRTKRRNQFLRRVILVSCWLLLCVLVFDSWAREQTWHSERERLVSLSSDQGILEEDYTRLTLRNEAAGRDRTFIREVVENRLPPVPDRFLAFVASILPRDVSLTSFSVNWNEETNGWRFRLDGMLNADPETARLTVNSIRRELSGSPLGVRFIESIRPETELNLSTESTLQPFSLEGGLFEH